MRFSSAGAAVVFPEETDQSVCQEIGERLRARREFLLRSRREIAGSSGAKAQEIEAIECGGPISSTQLMKLCAILETSTSALLGYHDHFELCADAALSDHPERAR
jgi:transcriptional regulator with XRE-family HTH domain